MIFILVFDFIRIEAIKQKIKRDKGWNDTTCWVGAFEALIPDDIRLESTKS